MLLSLMAIPGSQAAVREQFRRATTVLVFMAAAFSARADSPTDARGSEFFEKNIRPLLNHPSFSFIEHDVTEPLEIAGPVQRIFNLACPASPPHS